jgi:hypothetical protein
MRRLVLFSLLLWGAGARGDEPQPPSTAPASPRDLLKQTRVIERKTAALRGLRLRRPIPMGVQSRAEIIKRVEQKLDKEYTAEEIANEAAVLKRLGLLPAALDYRATILELLKDQVAGYYDPADGKLHLADWIPVTLQELALSHEICHGLQDQHFGLKRFTKPLKENSDQQLAQMALVEGDCTGVMLEYALAPEGRDLGSMSGAADQLAKMASAATGSAKLRSAPRFLRETLLFPYVRGLGLVQRTRATHPWSVVSKMFKRPPESTEQVLHPKKYWAQERPVPVRPRSIAALAGYERIRQDVLGELQLSIYLEQAVGADVAARAAEGWGGDLLQGYRAESKAGAPLLVHLSTWDSEVDALEFANAQRHVLAARKLKPAADDADADGVWIYRAKGEEWSVQLRKQHVLTLHGCPPALRAALQREVWDEWRVGGRKAK